MNKCQNYDVIVIGGGAAGIAAAVGAVKAGASCLLIERNGCLGGQATSSNVASYCGFFTHGDSPRQIVHGVGEEVLQLLRELGGYDHYVLSPTKNAIVTFDEELLKYALDLLAERYRLDVLLHCRMVKVNKSSENRISSVECVDDENWYEFSAKQFVDASGDGNLAWLSGADIRYGDGKGGGYMSTKIMRMDHVSPAVKFSPAALEAVFRRAKEDGYKNLTKEAGIVFRTAPDTAYAILPSVPVPSLDARTLTGCEQNTRRQCQEYLKAFRAYMPGMEHARLVSTGYKMGLRDTRHLVGKYTLTKDDVLNAVKRPDAVARGAWPCEMHNDLTKMITYLWVKDDDYYDIPLGALQSANIVNLLCGGRMVSADPVAFASVRVMGIGFATGHAAGVAAACFARCERTDVTEIQKELNRQNAGIGGE